MEMTHHAISWFEIPTDDFDRARKFYSTIFDYVMPVIPFGGGQMGFLLHDQQGGGIGGAIVSGVAPKPSRDGARVYLNAGTDLTTVLNRVEAAGGRIAQPKTLIAPEMGHYAFFIDSEGNEVGLHSVQ